MNRLLLDPAQLTPDGLAVLSGRQHAHLQRVLRVATGDTVQCGVLGGCTGLARVVGCALATTTLRIEALDAPPVAPRPLVVVLALPRPPVFRRMLHMSVELGVETLVVIHTHRVEKSYWQSNVLKPKALRETLWLGLEQAGTTVPPTLRFARRFKPFVQDELPTLAARRRALLAHPGATEPLPAPGDSPALIAIGPEGGFVDYERWLLAQAGLVAVHMGPRIVRTETALPTLVGAVMR